MGLFSFFTDKLETMKKERLEKEQARLEAIKKLEEKVKAHKEKYSIPNDTTKVFIKDLDGFITQYTDEFFYGVSDVMDVAKCADVVIWKEGDKLGMNLYANRVSKKDHSYVMPCDLAIRYINIDNVLGFGYVGEIKRYIETKGGGVSIGGALVGSVIAGPIGAVLGGRKGITTEEKVEDNRQLYLIIKDEDKVYNLELFSFDYDLLKKVIPEKEIGATSKSDELLAKANVSDSSKNNEDIYSEIERLSALKDKGILTEEEFSKKKAELLSRI